MVSFKCWQYNGKTWLIVSWLISWFFFKHSTWMIIHSNIHSNVHDYGLNGKTVEICGDHGVSKYAMNANDKKGRQI